MKYLLLLLMQKLFSIKKLKLSVRVKGKAKMENIGKMAMMLFCSIILCRRSLWALWKRLGSLWIRWRLCWGRGSMLSLTINSQFRKKIKIARLTNNKHSHTQYQNNKNTNPKPQDHPQIQNPKKTASKTLQNPQNHQNPQKNPHYRHHPN